MSDTRPPAKRQRRDSNPSITTIDISSDPPQNLPVRSEIWMPYGDIVLQAENMIYRVNRDILARHSPVFQDVFLIPQPPNEETLEGCPIVQLSDSALDIQLLLTSLYNPYHNKTSQPFNLIACMLRLGRKYDIASFTNDAVSRIHHDFPARLPSWDRRSAAGFFEKIETASGILIDLLNLAYEMGIYRSIPALAFRCLDVYSLEKLFEGVDRGDGTRAALPDGTKVTLALALERIQLFQKTNLQWLREDDVIPSAGCKSRTKCVKE